METTNAYEQFKGAFLAELETQVPGLLDEYCEAIEYTLDRVAYDYDINVKNTALIVADDPVPQLVKIYLVVKKTEGLADGTLENYWRILKSFFEWCRKNRKKLLLMIYVCFYIIINKNAAWATALQTNTVK